MTRAPALRPAHYHALWRACLVVLLFMLGLLLASSTSWAQIPTTQSLEEWVVGKPNAASPLGPSDYYFVIENGLPKRVPGISFMAPDASNASSGALVNLGAAASGPLTASGLTVSGAGFVLGRTSVGIGPVQELTTLPSGLTIPSPIITGTPTGVMRPVNNLADVLSASTARGNIGAAALGDAASSGITIPSGRVLGRSTAGTGSLEELTTLPSGLTAPGLNVTGNLLMSGAVLASTTGTYPFINEPNNLTFWNTPGGSLAVINRMTRILAGGAVYNDGYVYFSGCTGCYLGTFTDLDWLGQMAHQASTFNGVQGVGGASVNFSHMAILTDPNSVNAAYAIPDIALTLAAEESTAITGADRRGINAVIVGNATQPGVGGWAGYWECYQVTTTAASTYCHEIEAGNFIWPTNIWDTAHFEHFAPVPIAIGCGLGLTTGTQYNCSVAMYVTANYMPFNAGIDFLRGSIAASGPNGEKPIIQMDADGCFVMYSLSGGGGTRTPVTNTICGDTSTNINLKSYGGGRIVTNVGLSVGGDVFVGGASASAISTTATAPFLYLPTSAGAPGAVPAGAGAGRTATEYDSTYHMLWLYDQPAAAWRKIPSISAGGGTNRVTLARGGFSTSAPSDTTEDVLLTVAVPAGIGPNAQIVVHLTGQQNAGGSNKTWRVRWGGTSGDIIGTLVSNTIANLSMTSYITNANATGTQWTFGEYMADAAAGALPAGLSSVNTTSATSIIISCQKAIAADVCVLNQVTVDLISDGT